MLEVIAIFALLALGLTITEIKASKSNIGAEFNGFGAIEGVLKMTADNPMRHRVLIPLVVGYWPREWQFFVYVVWRWFGHILAPLTMYLWLCVAGYDLTSAMIAGLMLMALIAGTFWHDYADYTWEMAFVNTTYLLVTLKLAGIAVVLVVLWAMLRESAIFGVVILAATQQPILAIIGALTAYWFTRAVIGIVFGPAPSYMKRLGFGTFPIKANLKELREGIKDLEFIRLLFGCPAISGFWLLVVALLLVKSFSIGLYSWDLIIPGVIMLGAAFLYGKWDECRIWLAGLCPFVALGVRIYG